METMIMELLKEPGNAALRQALDAMHIADIAKELTDIDRQGVIRVFRLLSKDKAAEVFAYLDHDVQQGIIETIADREIGSIINELFLDDAVDFIEEMPANVVKRVLANVTPDTRDMINQILKYPEDSAGSIMTIEFVDLKAGMTVADAFAHIRDTGTDKETIYTCYVIDNARRLIGMVSVRTLFLSRMEDLITEIMEPVVVSAHTHEDREALVNSFRMNGLMAMPVVDNENRLVGIVTFDDALQVQEEETTEDFEKMAAMSPSEETYLKTSVLDMAKNRLPWLFLLNLSVFITGAIVARYEAELAVLPILVTFLPMLMDTSGDAGSQSSTLIIRGMAVNEIKLRDAIPVLWKELRVALTCGVVLSAINFARVMLFGHGAALSLTVSIALFVAIVLAKILGAMLPLGAKIVKIDPAVMAGPLLTTIVDAATLVVYLNLARTILQI